MKDNRNFDISASRSLLAKNKRKFFYLPRSGASLSVGIALKGEGCWFQGIRGVMVAQRYTVAIDLLRLTVLGSIAVLLAGLIIVKLDTELHEPHY